MPHSFPVFDLRSFIEWIKLISFFPINPIFRILNNLFALARAGTIQVRLEGLGVAEACLASLAHKLRLM